MHVSPGQLNCKLGRNWTASKFESNSRCGCGVSSAPMDFNNHHSFREITSSNWFSSSSPDELPLREMSSDCLVLYMSTYRRCLLAGDSFRFEVGLYVGDCIGRSESRTWDTSYIDGRSDGLSLVHNRANFNVFSKESISRHVALTCGSTASCIVLPSSFDITCEYNRPPKKKPSCWSMRRICGSCWNKAQIQNVNQRGGNSPF